MTVRVPILALAALTATAGPVLATEPHTTREIVVGGGLRMVLVDLGIVVPFLSIFVGLEGFLSGRVARRSYAALASVSLVYAAACIWLALDEVPWTPGVAGMAAAGFAITASLGLACDPALRGLVGLRDA